MVIPQRYLSKVYLIVLILCTSSFLFITYNKYKDDKYVMWDGYVYLVYSYSVLSEEKLFLDKIRSPLLSLVIPPDLEIARIVNCIYFLVLSIFVFLIVKKLTKNSLLALFGGILVGTNPYLLFFTKYTMSDLPAILFFLIGLYFYFENRKLSELLSGVFFGFSFVFRPDIGVLLLPLFLFKIRDKLFLKYCLSSFLIAAVLLNFLFSSFVFSRWIYPPIEYVRLNFLMKKSLASQVTSYNDYFWFLRKFVESNIIILPFLLFSVRLLSNDDIYTRLFIIFVFFTLVYFFAPKVDERIYITKAIPLSTIISSLSFKSNNRVTKSALLFFYDIDSSHNLFKSIFDLEFNRSHLESRQNRI
jgi:hypothetical protein